MDNLPVKNRVEVLVWYSDLDKYINEKFGRKFNSGRSLEAGQDTILAVSVSKMEEGDESFKEIADSVEAWLSSPLPEELWDEDMPEVSFHELMDYLCTKDLWPEGTFYLHVWW